MPCTADVAYAARRSRLVPNNRCTGRSAFFPAMSHSATSTAPIVRIAASRRLRCHKRAIQPLAIQRVLPHHDRFEIADQCRAIQAGRIIGRAEKCVTPSMPSISGDGQQAQIARPAQGPAMCWLYLVVGMPSHANKVKVTSVIFIRGLLGAFSRPVRPCRSPCGRSGPGSRPPPASGKGMRDSGAQLALAGQLEQGPDVVPAISG